MKLRHKIASGIAAGVLAVGLGAVAMAPAHASPFTSVKNIGTTNVQVRLDSGASALITPGSIRWNVAWITPMRGQCYRVYPGATPVCASVWYNPGIGNWNVKEVPTI